MLYFCGRYRLFVDESYEYDRKFVTDDCVRASYKYSLYHDIISYHHIMLLCIVIGVAGCNYLLKVDTQCPF